jgi:pyridoxamine 5'-phosphate oxidase
MPCWQGGRVTNNDDLRPFLRTLPVFPDDLPAFDPDEVPDDPVSLFHEWLRHAADEGILAAHAATLATAEPGGGPAARVLILKDVDLDGWSFATHADSPKGRHLAEDDRVAMTFFWPQVGRQVRIRGRARPADHATSASDFLARPADSRVATLVGRQSQPLERPSDYAGALTEARARLTADPDLIAESWTVYVVRADSVEFWQAAHDRAHVRLRYQRADGMWTRTRLWP